MIRPVVSIVFSFALASCSADTSDATEEMIDEVADTTDVSVSVEMPPFPLARAGQIAVATSHRQEHYIVNEVWDAWVGKCAESGIVQVIAKTNTHGVAVLVVPAPTDSGDMVLPVVAPNDSAPPDSSARVALQIYPEDRAYVLKGVEGTVEIDSVTQFVSGRFATRVVEATYRDTVFAAASFNSLPIEIVGEEYCRPLASPIPPIPGEGLEPKPIPVGQAADNG